MKQELNDRVAAEVMSWNHRGPHPIHGSSVWATGEGDVLIPDFSNSIEQAWTVVNRMRWLGYQMEMEVWLAERVRVRFYLPGGQEQVAFRDSAIGAPMAICLAALAAIGSTVKCGLCNHPAHPDPSRPEVTGACSVSYCICPQRRCDVTKPLIAWMP